LPFSRFGLRNWRLLEPRNVHLSTPPRQSPGKTSPTNHPTSGVHSSPAPLGWSAMLTHAAATAYAASVQGCDGASEANVEGIPPSFSELLAQTPPEHPPASRLPLPAT